MARPLVHDVALRATLLAATARLVAERGPGNVALRDVAAAAGTSTTAIYSLFGGKGRLLAAVTEHAFDSFGTSQRAAATQGLEALGRAYRRWALENPSLYALMFGGAAASGVDCEPAPDVAASAMAPLHAAVGAVLARAGSSEPAPLVAAAIWGQVHGLVSLELARVPIPGSTWDEAYEAALRGIGRLYAGG